MTQITYDKELINDMCSKVDLLEYASKQYDFENKGGRYYCKCPIHSENTASMLVDKDRFYCFGCTASGNIIKWMRDIEGLSWNATISKLSNITGTKIKNLKSCEALNFYKEVKRSATKIDAKIVHDVISSEIYDKFSDEIPQEWIDEGISEQAMKKYEIRVDNNSNRIVYPVYDNDDNLISVKGRTRFESFKELGIAKYMNYYKLNGLDFFAGMKQSREEILNKKSCVIFEGIKSSMKAYDMNYLNTISAETSCLNDEQTKILIKMGIRDVTIAFDSDVCMDKILKCTSKLRRFTNVFVIKDTHKLLGEKESPVDRGKDIFEQLMKERIKI